MTRTLLERLRRPAPTTGTAALRDSIRANLERLLNSHEGLSAACPDYGLPELVAILRGLPDTRGEIERAIQRAIESFEPRLGGVRVTFIDDARRALVACFRITAHLVADRNREPLSFETEMGWPDRAAGGGGSKVRVSPR